MSIRCQRNFSSVSPMLLRAAPDTVCSTWARRKLGVRCAAQEALCNSRCGNSQEVCRNEASQQEGRQQKHGSVQQITHRESQGEASEHRQTKDREGGARHPQDEVVANGTRRSGTGDAADYLSGDWKIVVTFFHSDRK